MTPQIDIKNLAEFNEVMEDSSSSVAENLSTMTSVSMDVEVKKLRFLEESAMAEEIGDVEDVVCVYCRLDDEPHGVFAVTFSPENAATVSQFMMESLPDEYGEQHETVVQEIGNIMTSGFVDGLADMLGKTIEITTPTVFDGERDAVAEHLKKQTDSDAPDSFVVLNTLIHAVDHDVSCRAFLLPNVDEFAELVNSIPDIERDIDEQKDSPFDG
jgi:chemotaxis protein CheC